MISDGRMLTWNLVEKQLMHYESAMEAYSGLKSQCIRWTAHQDLLARTPTISMPCSPLGIV